MIILDKPYVSDFLEETLTKYQFPVLKNNIIEEFDLTSNANYWDEDFAINEIKKDKNVLIYSNSENSINWINNNLRFSGLPDKINIFKDKVKFRKLISKIYPDFFFLDVKIEDLEKVDISKIKMPFIIKPAVGFCSMGVYFVNSEKEWKEVLNFIEIDIKKTEGLYPLEVIDSSKFIIEENIAGDEYAIDVYFDKKGEPVILNIFKHIFSSEKDVSDRVYLTSKEIIENNLDCFNQLLTQIGKLADLSNFPMHIEVRIDKKGKIIPIEVNPMRFAGWCTTDMVYFAYGINPYKYYFEQLKPDWKNILAGKENKIYSLVLADIPGDIKQEEIIDIDYEAYFKNFSKILEIRKINYQQYPIFAFVFIESEDYSEIAKILKADFHKYIKTKSPR